MPPSELALTWRIDDAPGPRISLDMTKFNAEGQETELPLELVAIDMGYGHLRPAHSISTFLGGHPILLADAPPLASGEEQEQWRRARRAYEALSRASSLKVVGPLLSRVMAGVTHIPPLFPTRDLSSPTWETKMLETAGRRGMGRTLAARLDSARKALLTTFYAPALLSDLHGAERVFCVITDSDVHRVWVPSSPDRSNVTYLAPTPRVERRLLAYGVSQEHIIVTGFPLPHELIGGPTAPILEHNLRRRLKALDPSGRIALDPRARLLTVPAPSGEEQGAPHLVFAVGGAGAQSELAARFVPSLAPLLRSGKLKVTLVAGVRERVRVEFERVIAQAGLERERASGQIQILHASSITTYFREFNRLLAQADILWTKPSELCFYAALGLPLILSNPVGSHEMENRRWVQQAGAAVLQGPPESTADWLSELLEDGTLAGAALAGAMRLPRHGLYRIVELVLGSHAVQRAVRMAEGDLDRLSS